MKRLAPIGTLRFEFAASLATAAVVWLFALIPDRKAARP